VYVRRSVGKFLKATNPLSSPTPPHQNNKRRERERGVAKGPTEHEQIM
jgi:hypothetical protein